MTDPEMPRLGSTPNSASARPSHGNPCSALVMKAGPGAPFLRASGGLYGWLIVAKQRYDKPMPNRTNMITGAAGEYYVAYQLSAMGYVVGVPRANVPGVDLLVADVSGRESVAIQVKTSSGAKRVFKRNPENGRWEFDVGERGRHLLGPNLLYVFVDLRGGEGVPDVFVVPSAVVHGFFNDGVERLRYMMWIPESEAEEYRDRWDIIEAALHTEQKTVSGASS